MTGPGGRSLRHAPAPPSRSAVGTVTAAVAGSGLMALVASFLGEERAGELLAGMDVHPDVLVPAGRPVARTVVAQALGVVLFDDLLGRVPSGAAYVAERWARGGTVFLDHGAVRTVEGVDCGELAQGQESLARVLAPLGYAHKYTYELIRLGMTGRSWCHLDLPAAIPQYFVSELHAGRFSEPFRASAGRVVGTSRNPVTSDAQASLDRLAADGALPPDLAAALLPVLVACFGRHHDVPAVSDYEVLLAESAEMAWIATEGNAFNHATDRVGDVDAVAQRQRELGRPIKDKVEVSASGRVRQTAFRAATVQREFLTPAGQVTRAVPGSFYEFITRAELHASSAANDPAQGGRLDLAFDAGNATGIFGMTATRA